MEKFQLRTPILAAIGICTAFCAAPGAVFADDAQDIQQLKDQVKVMQQKIDSMSATPEVIATKSEAKSTSLTWHGVTLYGTVDMGIAYITHGAPLSGQWGPGLPFFIQNFSNRSIVSIGGNGLSQSKLGLSGVEPLWGDDLSAVFRIETGFDPWSGRLVSGPGSLIDNNGKAASTKISAGDSSRAGQPFQGASYVGMSSKTFGTVTFGRQNGLELDLLAKYDPQAQSQAFSPIGLSGTVGGAGATETNRLDNSAKYALIFGPVHFAYIHQFGTGGYYPSGGDEVGLGADFGGFSIDGVYAKLHDAVTAASLSAAQVAGLPVGATISNSLAATISDDTAYSVGASYNLKPVKFYAGYEHIKYANPDHPMPVTGFVGINGIFFPGTALNQTAYTNNKNFEAYWAGVRWSVTPQFDLTGAYYGYWQDSYAAVSCSNASAGTCSGSLMDASMVADYHFTKRFDTYGGVGWSEVKNGLAAGYLYRNEITTMVGFRFNF